MATTKKVSKAKSKTKSKIKTKKSEKSKRKNPKIKNRIFEPGERVTTPLGPGTIVYKRMAPPAYAEPEAYNVFLDDKKEIPGYTGTIIGAALVLELRKNPCRVIRPRRKIGKGKKARIIRVRRKICW